MSRFCNEVSMKITKSQYEFLVPKLEKLGYRIAHLHVADFVKYCYLSNSRFSVIGMTNVEKGYHIHKYNPDLFLALCAATEGKEAIVGEWLYNSHRKFLFQVKEIGAFNNSKNGIVHRSFECSDFRKPTIDELRNWFYHIPIQKQKNNLIKVI